MQEFLNRVNYRIFMGSITKLLSVVLPEKSKKRNNIVNITQFQSAKRCEIKVRKCMISQQNVGLKWLILLYSQEIDKD